MKIALLALFTAVAVVDPTLAVVDCIQLEDDALCLEVVGIECEAEWNGEQCDACTLCFTGDFAIAYSCELAALESGGGDNECVNTSCDVGCVGPFLTEPAATDPTARPTDGPSTSPTEAPVASLSTDPPTEMPVQVPTETNDAGTTVDTPTDAPVSISAANMVAVFDVKKTAFWTVPLLLLHLIM